MTADSPTCTVSRAVRLHPLTWCVCVLLCWATGQPPARSAAYPAPGRPVPASPCAQPSAPQWVSFVCRFMTADLWRAAGRPDFTAQDGSRWRPWYYGDVSPGDNNLLYEGAGMRRRSEGLLEALQKTGSLPDEYDPAYVSRYWQLFRYTPWSVHFERALGCGPGQIVSPYALTADSADRSQLLSFGWTAAQGDPDDPTAGLGAGALPVMLALADGKGSSRRRINALARGRGGVADYDRDGEVWVVKGKGRAQPIKDLDEAASRAARTGRLFVNGPGRSWRQGFGAAAALSGPAGGRLIYVYFAGNAFRPPAKDRIFAARFRYVLRRAVKDNARIALYTPGGRQALTGLLEGLDGVAVHDTRGGSPLAGQRASSAGAPNRCIDPTGSPVRTGR